MGQLTRLSASLELNSVQFKEEMDKSTAKVKQFRGQSKRAGKDVNDFGRHMRHASRNVAVIQGPLGSVAGRMSSMASIASGGVTPAMVGIGAAVSATSFALYEAVGAFSQLERTQLRTQALLNSTGYAAGLTSSELEQMAIRVGKDTLASAAGVRNAQGILLTFRSIQGDTFERSIELSQDLAEVMGTDITQAALQLGKALEDPTIGLTALRRSGVSFTESERDLVRQMVETGDVAEAQTFILDKLAQQIGGAGVGAGGGVAGQADLLTENWALLLQELGRSGPGDAASGMLAGIAGQLESLTNFFAEPTLNEQLDTLVNQRFALEESIAELQAEPAGLARDAQLAALRDRHSQVLEDTQAFVEKVQAIRDEERRAEEGAAEAAAQAESDRAAARQAKAEEAGAKDLLRLETRLANQSERIRMDHEKQLEQIRTLQLSKEDLERRGFENMELLRDELAAREEERYQAEVAKLNERQIQEQLREREALERIQKERERQRQKDLKEAEALAQKKQQLEQAVTNGAIGLVKSLTKEGSKARRLVVIAERAAALVRARIAMHEAIAKAQALDPTGAMAAKARVEGLLNIAQIAAIGLSGVAHGGLENVPAEGTFLLDRGERVLSPRQNEDLTDFLSAERSQPAGINVVVNEAPGVTTSTNFSDGVLTIDMMREDLLNGGEISQILSETHNVNRIPER